MSFIFLSIKKKKIGQAYGKVPCFIPFKDRWKRKVFHLNLCLLCSQPSCLHQHTRSHLSFPIHLNQQPLFPPLKWFWMVLWLPGQSQSLHNIECDGVKNVDLENGLLCVKHYKQRSGGVQFSRLSFLGERLLISFSGRLYACLLLPTLTTHSINVT